MSELPLAQRLLALFTSPECAEAIAGDFVEARGTRGAAWVWGQILSTSVSLCAHALASAPLRSMAVVAAGCVLFGSLAFAGFAPVALIPALLGTPASWAILSIAWWSGAFFTGFTLVHLSPTRGMPASLVLAIIAEALLLAAGPAAVIDVIAMLTVLPLLGGAWFARYGVVGSATITR